MNILLVSGPGISLKEPYNSGIEAFIVSLANELVDEGHMVDVIAAEAEHTTKFTLINPFGTSASEKPNFFDRLRQKRQFSGVDVGLYDIIHYNMFYPHLLSAGIRFNKPTFLTLHSPADAKRISAYKNLSRQTEINFVAISERVKCQWERALGIDISLVSNGINMDLWPVKSVSSGKYLLWSARINQEKNVAAAISVARHMQLPLKIAGRIADQRYFDEEVKPLLSHQIQYLGHVTQRELSQLAQHASAYLATATWQEPFGLAALEMLASGVPVVGFSTAVPPDWEHESVLKTESFNWRDLEELIKKSATVSLKACRDFAANLNIQNMTASYVKLYQKALLQDGIIEDDVFSNSPVLHMIAPQPQISE